MHDVQELFHSYSTPMIGLTLGFLAVVLISKASWLIKVPVILCALFAAGVFFYPAILKEYLGSNMKSIALICFLFSSLGFFVSVCKIVKSSFNSICWLMIAVIAGVVAFPNYTNFKWDNLGSYKDYISSEKVSAVVKTIKTTFLSKSLE